VPPVNAVAWPALLAGAAVAVAVGLPGPGQARLAALQRGPSRGGGGLARGAPGSALPRRRDPAGSGPAGSGPAGSGAAGGGPPSAAALPAGARAAAAGVVLLLAHLSGSLVVLLLAACGALAGQAAWRRHRARASRSAERLAAGEACLALAGELRAGRSPSEALATAAELARGPSRAALLSAAAAARLGGEVPAALLTGVRSGSSAPEVLRGLAACWQVCARAGSGLAGAVDRLAEGLRSAQVQEQAVQAALAGPRASAGLLAVLPLAGIGLAAGLGAQPGHVLLHTPVGVGCLVVGIALDGLGLWWTGRIVDRAGRSR